MHYWSVEMLISRALNPVTVRSIRLVTVRVMVRVLDVPVRVLGASRV